MRKEPLTAAEVQAFLDREFPQIQAGGRNYSVQSVQNRGATIRMHASERSLRPGGTISGPAMFALADLAMYVAVMASTGSFEHVVTTNLNINFLSRPAPGDLLGECRLLKLGKRLAVGEVTITAEGGGEIVAHATATYSIPPPRAQKTAEA